MRVGVLTGGGDCPGLNAVIRAAVLNGIKTYDFEMVGIRNGWAGLIDKDAELARLDKEIGRLDGEVKRVGGKLSNAGFVDKAPAEVIDKERAKLAEAEQAKARLQEQRDRIATL